MSKSLCGIKVDINWPDFMARHDLVWDVLPTSWREGPFLGNGQLGVMIYQDGDRRIRFEIGSSDVQDHRGPEYGYVMFAEPRLPIGHFILETVGSIQSGTMRLDLYNAELKGTLITDCGRIELKGIVHTKEMVIILTIDPSEGESQCRWLFHPAPAISPRQAFGLDRNEPYRTQPDYQPNPDPILDRDGEIYVCVQPLLVGGQTVTAWQERGEGGQQTLFATVAHSFPENTARSKAIKTITNIRSQPLEKLYETHYNWWNKFYQASFVSLPDQRLETFYWIQIYKLGSATRSDRPVMDNTGPWLEATPWPGLWWDLNVQLCYWPVYTANHLELGESLVHAIDQNQQQLIDNAPVEFQDDSSYIGLTTSQTFRMSYEEMARDQKNFHPFPGGLTWACHNLWLQYRYSMDETLLKNLVYPVLRRSINLYLHFIQEGNDGRLHLPETHSPEYGNAEDCNFDLALLRWGCRTLIAVTDQLNIDDSLQARWQDVLDRLTDYAVDENGLMIGRNVPYARSHRHYSHMLMIYPLYLMNWDQQENRTLIEISFRHWISFEGALQGYSYTAAASFAAHMKKGNEALTYLNEFLDKFVFPNTMYMEHGPVIETPITVNQSLYDMLLTSWGNSIRVFPSVPDDWNDVVFHNLRTEGAFLVSAVRKNGETQWMRIKSLAGHPCTVKTDMIKPVQVKGPASISIKYIEGGLFSVDLKKGEEVVLIAENTKRDMTIRPLSGESEKFNYYGRQSAGVHTRDIIY